MPRPKKQLTFEKRTSKTKYGNLSLAEITQCVKDLEYVKNRRHPTKAELKRLEELNFELSVRFI